MPSRLRNKLGRRYYLPVFVGVFVVLAVFMIAYAGSVDEKFTCGARYDSALQERSVRLTKIAEEDRQLAQRSEQNITRLITDAIAAAGDRQKGQAAAQRYLRTSRQIADRRAELERQRRAEPFPQPPEKACA